MPDVMTGSHPVRDAESSRTDQLRDERAAARALLRAGLGARTERRDALRAAVARAVATPEPRALAIARSVDEPLRARGGNPTDAPTEPAMVMVTRPTLRLVHADG
jgi:hypothetical protein